MKHNINWFGSSNNFGIATYMYRIHI